MLSRAFDPAFIVVDVHGVPNCLCTLQLAEDTKLKKRTGTPLYMAPDLFFGWYGVEVDVWAAGMLMYQLISGKLPFFGDNVDKLAKASPMKIFQAFMDSEVCKTQYQTYSSLLVQNISNAAVFEDAGI